MKRLTILAMGALLSVAGCQSTPEEPREVKITNQEQGAFAAYEQSKSSYETWLVTLKESKGLKLYSSSLYTDLLNSWNEAVEIYELIAVEPAKANESYSLFSSATYSEEFAKRLSEVANKHTAIMRIKAQADLVLSASQLQMHYLEQMNAATFFTDEYHALYDDYSELFEYIEDNEIDDAQTEQMTFLDKAKTLEVKVVLAKYIAPLEKGLSDFKREGYHKLVAISYAKAEAEISSAKNMVQANTRDLKVIEQAVADAEFELAHLRNVGSEVKLLSSVKNDKFESIVLAFEGKLLAVSKALNGSDYRDQPLRVQADLIVDGVNKLHEDKSTDELEAKVALLNANIEKLKLFNTNQVALLAESKSQSELLSKQLERSEFQVMSQQTLLDSYKQQLDKKLSEAPVAQAEEPAVAETEEQTVTQAEESAVAETEEQTVTQAEEPAVAETEEQTVTQAEEPAVAETEEQTVTQAEEPAVAETEEPAVTEVKEPAVTEVKEPVVTEVEEPAVTEVEEQAVTEVEEQAAVDSKLESASKA